MDDPFSTKPFVFVAGGLRDVARRFYFTNTYEVLSTASEPTAVLSLARNPSALDFFRHHPNSRNLDILDLAHLNIALRRDGSVDKAKVNEMIFQRCGLDGRNQLTRARKPQPIGHFHSAEKTLAPGGHVLLHPFGRVWGDWPDNIVSMVKRSLRHVPAGVVTYVICADYVACDGLVKHEEFLCHDANVRVLRNLSAPAAFNLVATASRFIGSLSSLSQVAAFENVPSLILHPAECTDFRPPLSGYAQAIWEHNGVSADYDSLPEKKLGELMECFLGTAGQPIEVQSSLSSLRKMPPIGRTLRAGGDNGGAVVASHPSTFKKKVRPLSRPNPCTLSAMLAPTDPAAWLETLRGILHSKDGGPLYTQSLNFPTYYEIGRQLQPKSILEIGVRFGYSLASLACGAGLKDHVYGIDRESYEPDSNRYAAAALKSLGIEAKLFSGDSKTFDVRQKTGLPHLDLIHIDGNHTTEGALSDLRKFSEFSKRLIVDDIFDTRVWKAVTLFAAEQDHPISMSCFNAGTGHLLLEL
jgi:hypothetical protein